MCGHKQNTDRWCVVSRGFERVLSPDFVMNSLMPDELTVPTVLAPQKLLEACILFEARLCVSTIILIPM